MSAYKQKLRPWVAEQLASMAQTHRDPRTFGGRLEMARLEKGFKSLQALSRALPDIDYRRLQKIESNTVEAKASEITALCECLGISTDRLLFEEGKRPNFFVLEMRALGVRFNQLTLREREEFLEHANVKIDRLVGVRASANFRARGSF